VKIIWCTALEMFREQTRWEITKQKEITKQRGTRCRCEGDQWKQVCAKSVQGVCVISPREGSAGVRPLVTLEGNPAEHSHTCDEFAISSCCFLLLFTWL